MGAKGVAAVLRSASVLAAVLVLAWAAACGGGEDSGLPTATVVVIGGGGDRAELTVEVPETMEDFRRGLSHRDDLPEDRGMLFVFPQDTETTFWMKDTSIPLSIAFIAADGVIVGIRDMEPFSTELHSSPQPYRYAVEVNQGWFQEHGLEVGDRVEIPDSVGPPVVGE